MSGGQTKGESEAGVGEGDGGPGEEGGKPLGEQSAGGGREVFDPAPDRGVESRGRFGAESPFLEEIAFSVFGHGGRGSDQTAALFRFQLILFAAKRHGCARVRSGADGELASALDDFFGSAGGAAMGGIADDWFMRPASGAVNHGACFSGATHFGRGNSFGARGWFPDGGELFGPFHLGEGRDAEGKSSQDRGGDNRSETFHMFYFLLVEAVVAPAPSLNTTEEGETLMESCYGFLSAIQKRVPWPGWEWRPTEPPMRSAPLRTIERPMPVPG